MNGSMCPTGNVWKGFVGAEQTENPGLVGRIRRQLNFSQLALMLLAVPTAYLVAFGSYGFRQAFGLFSQWVHDAGRFSTGLSQVLLLGLGGLVFGLVLKLMKWERFMGPADVIVAVHERDGVYRARGGLVTAACDMLSLGIGASVGRYGPAVQLGATVSSLLGRSLGLSRTGLRVLLGCGVAAAISASFNAPIAGAIFAHEVIIGHFSLRAFAPITVASVVAVGASRHHGFEYIALKLGEESTHLALWEYPAFMLIGVVAALIAWVYMNGVLRSGDLANRLRLPIWIQPAIGGMLAGLVGLWMPRALGLGEETLQQVLDPGISASQFGVLMLASLCLAKLAASVACLGFRFPGGVFSPAMFMGATLGGLAGFAAPSLDYQICVLVGMGALVSSVIGAPIATILIVFELTEDYQAATAVMIAVVAANALLTRYYARSIFHRQVLRWGIDLERPREQRYLASKNVSDIMSSQFLAVKPQRTANEMKTFIERGHLADVFVVHGKDRMLRGKLPLAVLVAADAQETAEELCQPVDFCLEAEEDLWSGMLGIENFVGYSVPVVENRDSMKLVGVVTESDFIAAYRRAVDEVRQE